MMRIPSLLLVALSTAPAFAQEAASNWWPAPVIQALTNAGDKANAWRTMLRDVDEAQRKGMAFLIENMPERDLRNLDPQWIRDDVALAYEAWRSAPWADRISEDLFFDAILPYAHVSEPRTPWRAMMRERFLAAVKDCTTPTEAVQALNRTVFPTLKVRYSRERKRADQSAQESMEIGMASCTGLSIILADACRAVGVPARLAGIANWPNKRGNHTWVEVWDGKWHFTGAAEPAAELNQTWFQNDVALATPGSRRNGVWAATWRRTGQWFPMVWAPGLKVPAVDSTALYLPDQPKADPNVTRLMVVVQKGGAMRRVSASIVVTDTENRLLRFAGRSKDESADGNDHLTFDVPKGRKWDIQARYGDDFARITRSDQGDGQELVRIELTAPDGTPAPSKPKMAEAKPADPEPIRPETAEPERKTPAATPAATTSEDWAGKDDLQRELARWFAEKSSGKEPSAFSAAVFETFTKNQAATRDLAWQAFLAAPHEQLRKDYQRKRVRTDNREAPYTVKFVGERPDSGWGLVIAMHGGGGVPKRFNDSQWRHMQIYYKDHPEAGGYAYVALRAPNDTWNGFYDQAIAPLVDRLIRQFAVCGGIDTDKVVILGYSHGGYGAFGIGPKIPDRFSAIHASASAPTPGITAGENLRSTNFSFMVGEKDTAYGRLERCQGFDKAIQQLRGDRTDIYPVTFEFIKGNGHTGLPDRDKLKTLVPLVRNPTPTEVTWRPTGPEVKRLFWLGMDEPKGVVTAIRKGNRVDLTRKDVGKLTLYFDERTLSFDHPLTITTASGANFTIKMPSPLLDVLCETLWERGDARLSSTFRVTVN